MVTDLEVEMVLTDLKALREGLHPTTLVDMQGKNLAHSQDKSPEVTAEAQHKLHQIQATTNMTGFRISPLHMVPARRLRHIMDSNRCHCKLEQRHTTDRHKHSRSNLLIFMVCPEVWQAIYQQQVSASLLQQVPELFQSWAISQKVPAVDPL